MGIYIKEPEKDILQRIIANSDFLKQEQKILWFKIINVLKGKEIDLIIENIRKNHNNLKFLTENLQEKLQALETQDEFQWEKIIIKEKIFLEA